MRSSRRNIQTFTADVNGVTVQFTCWTTSTRCGFCHTASCDTYDTTDSKVSYYNRTWETFTYEKVLGRAIDKLPYKSLRDGARAQIIEKTAQEKREECQAFSRAFEALHSSLNQENKDRLAASDIEIKSQADASVVMGLMTCMAIAQ